MMQPKWAPVQPRKSYPECVREFDQLQDDEVQYTPYYSQELAELTPLGLSRMCDRDAAYWMTKKVLVFDIFVEPYSPHRVMRQFGRRQVIPPPVVDRIPANVHRYVRPVNYALIIIILSSYFN